MPGHLPPTVSHADQASLESALLEVRPDSSTSLASDLDDGPDEDTLFRDTETKSKSVW